MINSMLQQGEIEYYPHFFSLHEADFLLPKFIKEIPWKAEQIKIFGKEVLQPRLTAWYGDATAVYTYSGLTNFPLPWTPDLSEIRDRISAQVQAPFNSVLLNYYRGGSDYMGWHSDDERELGTRPVIASVTFGQIRRFQLRHRMTKELITMELGHGSLLVMKGNMQSGWVHRVAPTAKAVGPRINLTFRKILS